MLWAEIPPKSNIQAPLQIKLNGMKKHKIVNGIKVCSYMFFTKKGFSTS